MVAGAKPNGVMIAQGVAINSEGSGELPRQIKEKGYFVTPGVPPATKGLTGYSLGTLAIAE